MKKIDNLKAREIKSFIDAAKKILLHCHPFPDPDSIGSVLALREFLIQNKKEVTAIIGDSDYPQSLKNLNLRNKILPLNYFQIEPDDFDLFIILDSSSKSQISKIAEVQFPKNMKTIVIDHHTTNKGFGDINFVIKTCASTTHVLYKLFELWGAKITKDMALYLFIGLFADTGGFRYLSTTPEVFSVANDLTCINPSYHSLIFDIENSKTPLEVEMTALALSSIKKFFNDKVAFSFIPYSVVKRRNLSKEEALEGLIPDMLRSVVGWEIVASLVEFKKGETIVSLRTRNEKIFDVSKIAMAVGVGGGGHPGAAGTTVIGGIEVSKKDLLLCIERLYGGKL